jgi:uroporphyrinogen-III synthase
MKVKKILVSQPQPENDKSPYFDLAQKFNVQIDFKPFIRVQGLTASEFRKQKIYLQDYSATIFTSKNAVDHFFRMCNELRYTVPETLKYFCITEAVALYTQKYIVYRKRKIFFGNRDFSELVDLMKKHADEQFLFPASDVCKDEHHRLLEASKINYSKAVFYKTVHNEMNKQGDLDYDLIIFFSPEGIKSLFKNFPDFKQENIQIGAFGNATAQAITSAGLHLDLQAPLPEAPSMTMALELYLQKANNSK